MSPLPRRERERPHHGKPAFSTMAPRSIVGSILAPTHLAHEDGPFPPPRLDHDGEARLNREASIEGAGCPPRFARTRTQSRPSVVARRSSPWPRLSGSRGTLSRRPSIANAAAAARIVLQYAIPDVRRVRARRSRTRCMRIFRGQVAATIEYGKNLHPMFFDPVDQPMSARPPPRRSHGADRRERFSREIWI